MKKKIKFIYFVAPIILIMTFSLSIVCASFNQTMLIDGTAYARVNKDVRIMSIVFEESTNSGRIEANPKYSEMSTVTYTVLPNLNSTVKYKIKVRNNTTNYINVYDITDTIPQNSVFDYDLDLTSLDSTYHSDLLDPGTEAFIYLTIKYKEGVTLPVSEDDQKAIITNKYDFDAIYASELSYSNSTYTTCTNVQCALDEISRKVETGTIFKVGDYISMTPTTPTYTIDDTKTGCSESNSSCSNSGVRTTQNLTLWRVLKVNNNGTVDAISHYVDDSSLVFYGSTGYTNYVGVINSIAKNFENPNYTVGSRAPGYSNQTEYITNTSYLDRTNPANYFTCTTGTTCSNNESLGGGDTAYLNDYKAISAVYNTTNGTLVNSTSLRKYYLASRAVTYASGTSSTTNTFYIRTTGITTTSFAGPSGYSTFSRVAYASRVSTSTTSNWSVYGTFGIRPILVFKPGLVPSSGDGSFEHPYTLVNPT